ncbi:MAG: LuxR C-terminal-related transcriptional regulator [Saprospiraceae bacterium]
MPTNVVIADSQYLIRVGLRHLLDAREDMNVVGDAEDMEELQEIFSISKPDVLIFDYNKPDYFAQDDLDEIKRLSPNTGILIISADDERQSIYSVLEKGVNSFITKQCSEDEIYNAINATAKGEKFFCNKVLEYLLQKSFGEPKQECVATPLSPREIEVVKMVVEGKTAKEISAAINLSIHTIYTHRKNIMKKLGFSSASELVLYAVRNGLVDSEGGNNN